MISTKSPIALLMERSWLQGTFISTVAYGGNLVFFVLNFNLLWNRAQSEIRRNGRFSSETGWLLGYITFIIILCSTMAVVEVYVTQPGNTPASGHVYVPPNGISSMEMKLANMLEPGSFQHLFAGIPAIVGNICFSLITWSASVLLLWRCYVVYRSSKSSLWLLLFFPALMYFTSFASGVLYLIKIIDSRIIPLRVVTLAVIHGTIVLTSNLIFTFMIVMRLYLYRRSITSLVGVKYAGHYTSIASMFIESAAVVNILMLLILIALALKSPFSTLILLGLAEMQALASFMIIYRVAKGTAWSSGTANELIAQNVGTIGAFNDSSLPEAERLSAMRYRVTSQITQTSTGFIFNHGTVSSSMLSSSVRDSSSGRAVGGSPCQQACVVEEDEEEES